MRSPKLKNISIYCLLLVLIVMVAGIGEVKGQYTKVHATYVTPNTGGTTGAAGAAGTLGAIGAIGQFNYLPTNFPNLNDADYNTNYATISAKSGTPGSGLIPGSGGQSTVYINLNFDSAIKPVAGTQIFLKVQALVNSSGLLGSLFSTPLAYASIQGYSGVTPVGSSFQLSSLTTTPLGDCVYTSSGNLTSIKITVLTDIGSAGLAGLLGGGASTSSLNIYDVYMFDPTCNPPVNTSVSVTGISLGGAVLNPENAIDNDLDTKSTLSVGLLSLLATIKQTVYFSKVSNPGDAATITFSVPAAVLNLGLFNGITLQAYNGATAVGTPIQISSLLSLDLLGLLGNGTRFTGSYVPSVTTGFDRIEISTSAVASLLQNFYVHEVQQTPPKPTFIIAGSASSATICSGTSVTLKADAPGSGNELRWYTAQTGGTLLATADTYTPSPALTATTTYYVATAKTGCAAESERVPVTITVNTIIGGTIATNQTICHGDVPATFTTSGGSGTGVMTYQWQKSVDNVAFSNISGAINLTYTETAALNQTTYYRRIDTSTLNTVSCSANTNHLTITINPKPLSPHVTIITNSQY